MQPSTLKGNLNSSFLQSVGKLRPKSAPKIISVYVESHQDKAFWRSILNDYSNEKLEFDIQLPSKTDLTKGKGKALERNNDILTLGLGEYLIICIDSDYDYVLQGHTPQSRLINDSDFIFQTYAYAIENLKCYSSSLHLVCVQSVNSDKKKIDFVELLKLYSNITYELFIWSVAFKLNNDNVTLSVSKLSQIISISGVINVHDQGKTHLENFNTRISKEVDTLKTNHPTMVAQVESLKTLLKQLGITEENTYLFLQGHALEDGFVLKVLRSVCSVLQSEIEREIMTQAIHEDQKRVELNHYRNGTVELEKVLRNNTEFKNCFLFHKTKADLDRFIASIT